MNCGKRQSFFNHNLKRHRVEGSAAEHFVYPKCYRGTSWQIESRELTVEHVVEDSVGGSDVFVCLLVSQL